MLKTFIISLAMFVSTQSHGATTSSVVLCELWYNGTSLSKVTNGLNDQIRSAEKLGYRIISAPSITSSAICVTATAEVSIK